MKARGIYMTDDLDGYVKTLSQRKHLPRSNAPKQVFERGRFARDERGLWVCFYFTMTFLPPRM